MLNLHAIAGHCMLRMARRIRCIPGLWEELVRPRNFKPRNRSNSENSTKSASDAFFLCCAVCTIPECGCFCSSFLADLPLILEPTNSNENESWSCLLSLAEEARRVSFAGFAPQHARKQSQNGHQIH